MSPAIRQRGRVLSSSWLSGHKTMNLERWQRRTKLLLDMTDKRARGEDPDLSQQDVWDYALAWGYWRGVAAALRMGVVAGDWKVMCLDAAVADTAASPVTLARIFNKLVERGFSWPPEELIDPVVAHLVQECKPYESGPKGYCSPREDPDASFLVFIFRVQIV